MWRQNKSAYRLLITGSETDYDVFALILNCLHETDKGGTNNVGLQFEGKIKVYFINTYTSEGARDFTSESARDFTSESARDFK